MTKGETSGAAFAVPGLAVPTFAVILGGGAGTRLWPSSRRARPKQLLSLGGPESLLAAAVRRAGTLVGVERTLIVTAADQEAAVRAQIVDLPPENIVAEPVPRNTAAAVGLGAVEAARRPRIERRKPVPSRTPTTWLCPEDAARRRDQAPPSRFRRW